MCVCVCVETCKRMGKRFSNCAQQFILKLRYTTSVLFLGMEVNTLVIPKCTQSDVIKKKQNLQETLFLFKSTCMYLNPN